MKLFNSLVEARHQWARERLVISIQNSGFSACIVFSTFLSTTSYTRASASNATVTMKLDPLIHNGGAIYLLKLV